MEAPRLLTEAGRYIKANEGDDEEGPAGAAINKLSNFAKSLGTQEDISGIRTWNINNVNSHGEEGLLSISSGHERGGIGADDTFQGGLEDLVNYIKQEYPDTNDFEFNTEDSRLNKLFSV